MRISAMLASALTLAAAPATTTYLHDVAQWRAAYEADLKAPGGWLSVAGLFWLREGENVIGSDARADVVLPPASPARAGILRMRAGVVSYESSGQPERLLKSGVPGPPDIVKIGTMSITVIRRGDRTGVRLKDPEAATLRGFTGCRWFPVADKWRIRAAWAPWREPRKIAILNVLGMTSDEPAPGYAEFTLGGRQLRLEPIIEDDHLFFLFRDETSRETTYAAGRFLYAPMPRDGVVDLDFNKAENPPCAFTAFATCPLPPKQNVLPVAIAAGEKRYGKH